MATKPPPAVKNFSDDSLERKVYNIADELKDYLPIANDRNRLGYSLYKYVTGEGDDPEVLVKTLKLKLEGLSKEKLAELLNEKLQSLNLPPNE